MVKRKKKNPIKTRDDDCHARELHGRKEMHVSGGHAVTPLRPCSGCVYVLLEMFVGVFLFSTLSISLFFYAIDFSFTILFAIDIVESPNNERNEPPQASR